MAQLQSTIQTVTTDGTVKPGFVHIEFIFSTDFAGTIDGATFSGSVDASFGLDAPHTNTLGSVKYTISAGSARLVTF